MAITVPLFDLYLEGHITPHEIKITSAHKIHNPNRVCKPYVANIETIPVNVEGKVRYEIILDGEVTTWYGDYCYESLMECLIEISSFCLKEIATNVGNDILVKLQIDSLTA